MDEAQLHQLVDNYRVSNAVLDEVKNVRLLALVGPSGAGKTSIMKLAPAADSNLSIVGGVTSRQKRPGEIEGIEFVFRSQEEMIQGIITGKYVQVVISASGELYATRPDDYPHRGIGIMCVSATAISSFKKLFKEVIVAYIVPYVYEAWLNRFNERPMDQKERSERLREGIESYELALSDPSYHFVLNDDLNSAIQRVLQIVNKEKPDQEDRAIELAKAHLEKMRTLQ